METYEFERQVQNLMNWLLINKTKKFASQAERNCWSQEKQDLIRTIEDTKDRKMAGNVMSVIMDASRKEFDGSMFTNVSRAKK